MRPDREVNCLHNGNSKCVILLANSSYGYRYLDHSQHSVILDMNDIWS